MANEQNGGAAGVFDLENELTCSICTDILFQPLTLLDCLHTFCGSCLKEWFAWQATSAAHGGQRGNPYTCPSCRAAVRDTKADFRLTALSEGYLKANPGKGKTEAEKEESRKHYKPGDNVLPPLPATDGDDSDDERLLARTRDISLTQMSSRPARGGAERGAVGERHRRGQHSPPVSQRLGDNTRQQQTSAWVAQQAQRQRELDGHHVEHQPSLRSLLSGSGSGSEISPHDVQEEILQSIISEGLVNGIDLDSLTPQQEEELTERIAEAYRRRQRNRDRSRNRDRREESAAAPTQQSARTRQESPHRRHHRGQSTSTPSQQPQQTRTRLPISRPHVFEQSTADQGQDRQRSTSQTSQQSYPSETRAQLTNHPGAAATRSATDLSERPSTDEGQRERERAHSNNARSSTDPQNMHDEVRRIRDRGTTLRPDVSPNSNTTSPRARSHEPNPAETTRARRNDGTPNASTTSLPMTTSASGPDTASQAAVRPVPSNAALAPEPVTPETSRTWSSPSISCSRCSKQNIATELHYHCSKCRNGNFNMCLSCYRSERGCDHWFGFGFVAMHRWQRAAPAEGRPSGHEYPHVLIPRRYVAPQTNSPRTAQPQTSHSNQQAFLQEGAFCETCNNFANDFYWYCQDCLEGAWGYCHSCILKGKHCTHPLLPIAHTSTLPHDPQELSKMSFVPVPHLKPNSYVILPTATMVDCDICRLPIPPRSLRSHCYVCSEGDYDVCNECYNSLVASGKISHANGPNGWRRCLHGHRMAVVGYQDMSYRSGQMRITARGPVGGWRLKEEGDGGNARPGPPPSDTSLGGKYLAVYHRMPPERDAEDLVFPKNAEVRECEDLNADWSVGVYAGGVGVFPRNHTRRL